MKTRRILGLGLVAIALAACSSLYGGGAPDEQGDGAVAAPSGMASGSGGGTFHTAGDRAEQILEALPWHPNVLRADLSANGPVALTQIYRGRDDVLCVDASGRVSCLSARDLTPKWVSTLRAPLASPPAENATHYVFLEVDSRGAGWLQWFSRRTGAEADRSPARLSYSPSSGVSATASTAFVGSLGSPVNNKTVETVNLWDGTPGWGWRTHGRVVATPTVDPAGETVLVCCEDRTVTALPANSAGDPPSGPQWEAVTLGTNSACPTLTRDWAFVVSEDNFVRCFDVHGGQVRWMKGTDGPNHTQPWLLGGAVTRSVALGGEGSGSVKVESYEGWVFVRNENGLHCFDADSGAKVFLDPVADRPLVKTGAWVVTLDRTGNAQLRKGKDLAVADTVGFGLFDFLPTNSRDGTIIAGTTEGVILLAVPR